ncbi:histidine decarboxylase, pyruvoyl type [Salidesulfovibrio onnuriiensis]|uniref:histidine decarboxylase, pyruvoyl type n=1 Tax=Salidesulfovibrio onnuriiensis TaxID=2583823 RepID=UPI0011C91397|nr:histidine decarboxylase, pyruvoyl type [Salidesulfovibrio onnuriiensis]
MIKTISTLLISLLCLAVAASTMAGDQFDKTAIGPYAKYCDGFGMPGATGQGYVSVLKVSTGVVQKNDDALVDGIVAYDRAEANDAYIGQINMETASSFNGLNGSIWGYDLAVAEDIRDKKEKPLFMLKQYDGSSIPVYDAKPLLQAGESLFGTAKARRFPPAPGAHVICANKSVTTYRPKQGKPDKTRGEAYGVWSYIAIAIAKDRTRDASLFIEDAGIWDKNANEQDLLQYLDEHRKTVVWSVGACGEDQSVLYDRVYIGYAHTMMKPGEIGTGLTVAPYVVLARNAVPGGNFQSLYSLSLKEWEKKMGF